MDGQMGGEAGRDMGLTGRWDGKMDGQRAMLEKWTDGKVGWRDGWMDRRDGQV